MLFPYFRRIIDESQAAWRAVIIAATHFGVPTPAFSAALGYYDSYRRERLPANLLQAQRDYFGAHTYQRIDRDGTFHTEWLELRKPPVIWGEPYHLEGSPRRTMAHTIVILSSGI